MTGRQKAQKRIAATFEVSTPPKRVQVVRPAPSAVVDGLPDAQLSGLPALSRPCPRFCHRGLPTYSPFACSPASSTPSSSTRCDHHEEDRGAREQPERRGRRAFPREDRRAERGGPAWFLRLHHSGTTADNERHRGHGDDRPQPQPAAAPQTGGFLPPRRRRRSRCSAKLWQSEWHSYTPDPPAR